ncbi:Rieske (2Fe-2S) protein [Amycolatopsis sp. TRM77291]
MLHVVGKVSEFRERDGKIVEIDGKSIGVFRVDGRFFAIRNYCPHQGAPLCEGHILAGLRADEKPASVDESTLYIACPWHGWEYDIRTGQSYFGAGHAPARTYRVHTETGRRPGPYTADSYVVTVEDGDVVVDTSRRADANDREQEGTW